MPGVGLDMATMASSNTCSSNLAGTVPPSTGAAAATAEEAVKLHALRPLEELTEADIRQLTREDCRRYLKERGMRRPSWNKAQAIQQVLSLKSLMYSSSSKSSSAKAGATAPTTESPGRGAVTILSQERGRTVSPLVPPAQTKELLDKLGPSSNNGNNNNNASDPRPPVTAFGVPQHQSFLSSLPQDSGGVKVAAPVLPLGSAAAPGGAHRAQLTIFYSGIVNVYDDVPLEKAQAIMLLASSKAFQVPTPLLPAVAPLLQLQREPVPSPPPPPPGNRCYVSPFLSTTPEPIGATPASVNNTQHEESTDPGLPQARTVSLQRFLAKRRERISANPSYYRRSDKQQSSKRSKPSSSPPPPPPLQLVPSRAGSPLLSTTSSHNIPKHSTSDFSSRSRSTASSDTSGGSFRTTATTTTTTTTATMTFTGGGGNHSFYPIAGHASSQTAS